MTKIAEIFAKKHGIKAVANVLHTEVVADNAIRVVASFNRQPTNEELSSALNAKFDSKVTCVPGSFYQQKVGVGSVVVAGFMSVQPEIKHVKDAGTMKEIASNMYLDQRDMSAWVKEGNHLIRQTEDDIEEVASLIKPSNAMAQANNGYLVPVSDDFMGIDNTEVLAFFEPQSNQVMVGVRLDADNVYVEGEGTFEIAQNLVCTTKHLHSQDNPYAVQEVAAVTDPATDGYDVDKTLNYYKTLFGDNPEFWEGMEKQIRAKAMA